MSVAGERDCKTPTGSRQSGGTSMSSSYCYLALTSLSPHPASAREVQPIRAAGVMETKKIPKTQRSRNKGKHEGTPKPEAR